MLTEWLLQTDQQVFLSIHLGMANDLLDRILPIWRNKLFWVPVYLYMLVYLIRNHRPYLLGFLVSVGLLITVSDTLSSKVIKPWVERPRPCRSTELADRVRPLVGCGGGYSFTSSHAVNHFALAIFFMGTYSRRRKWRWLWLAWAASIAFCQVYVGVHYPSDVLAGGLLGAMLGWAGVRFYRMFTTRIRHLPL